MLPAEVEAGHRRRAPEQLAARVAHVEALTATVREAPGAGLDALVEVMRDPEASAAARGALMWVRMQQLEPDEAAYVLQALLTREELREPSLFAALELAADGNPASSRALLDAIEASPELASAARPVLWALLVAGPYDVECRAIAALGRAGDAEDARDLLRHFGAEPELYDRVRSAVRRIHERNGAHGLSIVDEDGLEGRGRLSLGRD